MNTKILIIESIPIIAWGLQKLLESEKSMRVFVTNDTSQSVLDVISEISPDLIICDIATDSNNFLGIDFIKQLKKSNPEINILVYSFADEKIYAERVLYAKANGFVSKKADCEKIRRAVQLVVNGKLFISKEIESKIVQNVYNRKSSVDSPVELLSNRELQILELISKGYKPSQVAGFLNLSPKTIENYRANIRIKLNVNTAFELYQFAVEWNKRLS